jgi:hypothetical protein
MAVKLAEFKTTFLAAGSLESRLNQRCPDTPTFFVKEAPFVASPAQNHAAETAIAAATPRNAGLRHGAFLLKSQHLPGRRPALRVAIKVGGSARIRAIVISLKIAACPSQ